VPAVTVCLAARGYRRFYREGDMAKRTKDLGSKRQAAKVRGGNPSDDRRNIRNSWDNITGRDLSNLTDGKAEMKRGRLVVKP
jgi:hypothetical protein